MSSGIMDLRGICFLNPPGLKEIHTGCQGPARPHLREQSRVPLDLPPPSAPSAGYYQYSTSGPIIYLDGPTLVMMAIALLFTGLAVRQTRALASMARELKSLKDKLSDA